MREFFVFFREKYEKKASQLYSHNNLLDWTVLVPELITAIDLNIAAEIGKDMAGRRKDCEFVGASYVLLDRRVG